MSPFQQKQNFAKTAHPTALQRVCLKKYRQLTNVIFLHLPASWLSVGYDEEVLDVQMCHMMH